MGAPGGRHTPQLQLDILHFSDFANKLNKQHA